MQLPSISSLFLGCAVLILLDELYLGRFWPQLEAWLAMHSPSTEGLVPAPATSRRLTIMTIHGRPDDLESEIIRRWVARDVREVHEMLASSDVLVCNETDRKQQLRRLLELDVQVRAHAPPTWPNLAPPPLGSPVALAREKALSPVAVAREALSFEEVEAPATSKLVPSLSSIVESRTLGDEGDEKRVGVSVSVGGATCQGGGQRQGGSGQWQGGVARARQLKADSAGKEKHADSPEGLPVLQWLPPGLPSPGCRQSLSLTHPTLLGLSSPTSAVLGVGSTATTLLVRPQVTPPVLYALRRASPASPGMQAATPVNVPEEQRNESSSRTSLAAAGLVSAAAAASDAERAQRMRMQLAGLQRPNSLRAGSPAASVQPSTSPLASLQPSTSPMASLQRPKSPPAGFAGPQALRNWVVPSRTTTPKTTPKGAHGPGPAASTAEDDSDRIPMAMMTDAISSLPPPPPSLVVSAPLLLPSGSSSKSGSPSISGDTSCPKAGDTGSSSASPCATPAESSRESPSDSTPFGSSLAAKLRRPTLFRRLLGAKSSTSSEGGNKGEC